MPCSITVLVILERGEPTGTSARDQVSSKALRHSTHNLLQFVDPQYPDNLAFYLSDC